MLALAYRKYLCASLCVHFDFGWAANDILHTRVCCSGGCAGASSNK